MMVKNNENAQKAKGNESFLQEQKSRCEEKQKNQKVVMVTNIVREN